MAWEMPDYDSYLSEANRHQQEYNYTHGGASNLLPSGLSNHGQNSSYIDDRGVGNTSSGYYNESDYDNYLHTQTNAIRQAKEQGWVPPGEETSAAPAYTPDYSYTPAYTEPAYTEPVYTEPVYTGGGGGGDTGGGGGDTGGGGGDGGGGDSLSQEQERLKQLEAARALAIKTANEALDKQGETQEAKLTGQLPTIKSNYDELRNQNDVNWYRNRIALREALANRGGLEGGAGRQEYLAAGNNRNNNLTRINLQEQEELRQIAQQIADLWSQIQTQKAANEATTLENYGDYINAGIELPEIDFSNLTSLDLSDILNNTKGTTEGAEEGTESASAAAAKAKEDDDESYYERILRLYRNGLV